MSQLKNLWKPDSFTEWLYPKDPNAPTLGEIAAARAQSLGKEKAGFLGRAMEVPRVVHRMGLANSAFIGAESGLTGLLPLVSAASPLAHGGSPAEAVAFGVGGLATSAVLLKKELLPRFASIWNEAKQADMKGIQGRASERGGKSD
ncbi:MAG: hypothetical protein PW734_07800 [Verrucomicrobium sp.]|nr:hypothetical protein [Verrucomicrobium sp.]